MLSDTRCNEKGKGERRKEKGGKVKMKKRERENGKGQRGILNKVKRIRNRAYGEKS